MFAAICASAKAISRLQYYAAAGEMLLFFDYLLTLPDEVCFIELRCSPQSTYSRVPRSSMLGREGNHGVSKIPYDPSR